MLLRFFRFGVLALEIGERYVLRLVSESDLKRKLRKACRRIPGGESGGNLVTHAAVTEGAGKLFRVQLLGKTKIDAAGFFENFDLVG